MLEWLRDGRAVFQIPFLTILIAIWILGPFSWITWVLALVIFVLCGLNPTWMAAMTFMLFVDACNAVRWVGNTVGTGVQKVVDVFRR